MLIIGDMYIYNILEGISYYFLFIVSQIVGGVYSVYVIIVIGYFGYGVKVQ